jgi:hypothetical protein
MWMGFRCFCGECLGWCMQTIELESVQIDSVLKNGHFGHHDIRMLWNVGKGRRHPFTTLTNASGGCASRHHYIHGSAERVCQHSCH